MPLQDANPTPSFGGFGIRGAISALSVAYNNDNENVLVIPHGANRGIGIACQATTFYMMLNAQASGNYFIRILHQG